MGRSTGSACQVRCGACFAALLGTPDHDAGKLAPREAIVAVKRAYRGETLVLETEFETAGGTIRVIDFMTPAAPRARSCGIVEGVSGEVAVEMELIIRFDYGTSCRGETGGRALLAIGGPDALSLWSDVPTIGVGLSTRATFTVRAGSACRSSLLWHPPTSGRACCHLSKPRGNDGMVGGVDRRLHLFGTLAASVVRSLITLKASRMRDTGRRRRGDDVIARKRSAACATGTIGSAGCVTRRSCCTR
jgi:hypothetical protein